MFEICKQRIDFERKMKIVKDRCGTIIPRIENN